MDYENPLFLFLVVVSGICWTIVYIDSIRIGFKDKTYAMPILALALNLCWEGLYAYVYLARSIVDVQGWITFVWFWFDVVILCTFLKFGKEDFKAYSGEKFFYPWIVFIFVAALVIQISFKAEFDMVGPLYAAFLQNLLMSVLYLNLIVKRKGTKGQTLTIAYAKCIGTLCATGYGGWLAGYQLAFVLGVFCFLFDVIYIVYMHKAIRVQKKCSILEER